MNRKQRREEHRKGIPKEVMLVLTIQNAKITIGNPLLDTVMDIVERHPKYFK